MYQERKKINMNSYLCKCVSKAKSCVVEICQLRRHHRKETYNERSARNEGIAAKHHCFLSALTFGKKKHRTHLALYRVIESAREAWNDIKSTFARNGLYKHLRNEADIVKWGHGAKSSCPKVTSAA